jgi:NAD(P)-dependent dehydrogenase (short-subunit alcohol dehydrogenase family)
MRRYPDIDLADAVVLITGGARGIGLATAEAFSTLGATVCVGDLDGDEAQRASEQLGLHAFELDVTSRASFGAVVDEVLARFGRVDVLVNNAGVMPLGDFVTEDDAVTRVTVDVNLFGPVNGMRLVLPSMISRGRGHVVNVCSMAGKIPIPGMAGYNASKFAAVGLTAAVRREYARTGVSISAVLPAAVRTRLASGVPLGRGMPTVEPEQIADAVVASCRTRRAEIPVPGWLTGWDLLDAVTPEPVMRLGRRLIGDDRGLHRVDPAGRADYDAALGKQVSRRG